MTIRLPSELRSALERDAEEAGHPMNTEIIRRLEASYRMEEKQRLERKLDAIMRLLQQSLPTK